MVGGGQSSHGCIQLPLHRETPTGSSTARRGYCRYVTPELADRLVAEVAGDAVRGLPHEALSPQEFRVMQLIAAGKGPSEIAVLMGLSAKTVGTDRARIMMKADWASNNELTKYCVRHKLNSLH